MVYFKIMDGTF